MQLTPAFFKLPPPPQVFQLITFPLPASVDDMSVFLVSENATAYRAGIAGLIKRLKTWAHARDPIIPFNHDARFLKIFDYKGTDKNINDINFRLFSDGIELLNQIVQKLESNKDLPLNVDEIVTVLITNLDVCAPGVYIYLSKVQMALQSNLAEELLTIRHNIVEAKAQAIVELHRNNILVGEGSIIHFVYSLVNLVVEPFGLRKIEDDLSAHGSPVFGEMKRAFLASSNSMWEGINPIVIIIHQILKNLDFDNILKHIKNPHYSTHFEQQLNKYGPDATFNIRFLFDDNALAEGVYIPQPHAQQRLQITLLNRLVKSGMLTPPTTGIEFVNDGMLSHYFSVKNGFLESADEHLYNAFLAGKNIQQTLAVLHPDLFSENYHSLFHKDLIIGKKSARIAHAHKQLRADVFYHLSRYASYPALQESKQELLKILLEPSDNPKILRLAPSLIAEYINETSIYLKILAMFSYEDRLKLLSLLPTHGTWISNPEQAGLYLSLFNAEQWPGLIHMTPSLKCVVRTTDLITLLRQLPAESRMQYLSLLSENDLMAMIVVEKQQFCELLNLIPVNHWGQAPLSVEYIRSLASIVSTPLISDKSPMMAMQFSTQAGGACKTLLLLNSLNAEAAQKFLTYFQLQGMHVYQLGLVLQYLDLDKWPFLLEHTKQLLVFENIPQLRSALESVYLGSPEKIRQFITLLSTENIRNLCKTSVTMQEIVSILPPHALPAWIGKVGLEYMQSIVTSFTKHRELIITDQVASAGPELLKPLLGNREAWQIFLSYRNPLYISECLKVLPAEFLDQHFKDMEALDWSIKSKEVKNNILFLLLSRFSKEHLRNVVSTPHNLMILLNVFSFTMPDINFSYLLLTKLGGQHLRAICADKNLFYQAINSLPESYRQLGIMYCLNVILKDHPDMMLNDLVNEFQLEKSFFDIIFNAKTLLVFLADKSVKQCTDIIRTFETSYLEQRIKTADELLMIVSNIWRPSALELLKKLNPEKLQVWFHETDNLFTLIALFADDHDSFYDLGPFLMKTLKVFDNFDTILRLNRSQLMYVMNLGILRNLVTNPQQLILLLKNHDVQDWGQICAATNYQQLFNNADNLHLLLSAFSNSQRGEFLKVLYNYESTFSFYFKKLIFGDPINFARLFTLLATAEPSIYDFDLLREMYAEPVNIQRSLDTFEDDHLKSEFLRFMYEELVNKRGFAMPKQLPPYCKLLALAHINNEIAGLTKTLEAGHMHKLYSAVLEKRQGFLLQMKGLLEVNVTQDQVTRLEMAIKNDVVYLGPLFERVKGLVSVVSEEFPESRKRGLASQIP